MKIKSVLIHSSILCFFLLFSALVYKPVLQGHYLYQDDYLRIWTSPWMKHMDQSFVSYARYMPGEGRPLNLLLNHLIFNKYINSLKSYEAANVVRIFGIIGLGLLAYVLYFIFKANKFRTDHSILLSLLICTLPPFQIYLGWIICLIDIYSVLLSALSFLILFKAVFKEGRIKKANVSISVIISIILFAASLCIYQPTATVYWALAVIPLIMIKNEDITKKWYLHFIIYFSAGLASMMVYFTIIKIFNLLLSIEFQSRGSLIHGAVNIYHRLIWFIEYPLNTASGLWQIIYYTNEVKLFVGMVIFAGILYGLSRTVSQTIVENKGLNLLLNSLCRYLLILVVIPLSYTAHLATLGTTYYGNESLYNAEATLRTLPALEIAMLLLFYWGLVNIAEFFRTVFNLSEGLQNKIVTVGLVILTVAASLLANHNVDKYFVKQGTNEYRYVKDAIQRHGVSKLSNGTIIYVKPAGKARIRGGGDIHSIYGEFYNRSSGSAMTRLALYELGIISDISIVNILNIDPETNEPIEEHDKRYKRMPEDDNLLKIDMTKMDVKETYDLIYYD